MRPKRGNPYCPNAASTERRRWKTHKLVFGHDGAIEAGESDWAMRLYTPDQKYNALWRAMSVPPQPLLGATLASHAHHGYQVLGNSLETDTNAPKYRKHIGNTLNTPFRNPACQETGLGGQSSPYRVGSITGPDIHGAGPSRRVDCGMLLFTVATVQQFAMHTARTLLSCR